MFVYDTEKCFYRALLQLPFIHVRWHRDTPQIHNDLFFLGGVHCTQTKWYTQFNKWFFTLHIPPVLWIPLDTVLVFQRDNYYTFHSTENEFTGRCTYTSNTNHSFILFIYIIHTQNLKYFKLYYYNKILSLFLY